MGEGYISFYEGGYSSLSPDRGNYVGFRLNSNQLSSTTSVQSANQLSEVISRIKEGVKNVELQPLAEGVFDSIPKQHFKEMHALMKLTGVKPSVHAPIIDPAGFGERGYQGEYAREDAERKLFGVLERAHELDPKGNIPVVFHSSAGVPGPEYRPGDTKKGEERFKIVQDAIINQETGQIQGVKEKRVYYPDHLESLAPGKDIEKQGKILSTKEMIENSNLAEWDNKIREAAMLQKEVEENMRRAAENGLFQLSRGEKIPQENLRKAEGYLERADIFFKDANLSFKSVFDKAYEYGTEKQRTKLKELAENWKREQKEAFKNIKDPRENLTEVRILSQELLNKRLIDLRSEIERSGLPQINVRAEDFAMDKAAKTFGNLAFKGYSKWKDGAPIIAVENLYQGMAFSKAEDMKKLVEKSKENFITQARGKGMSESEARDKANKLIGVTWDVGHLNMMKKHGFSNEDIKKETEKIHKLVKHVHLTDNFGYGDSHLAPGMGNVPMKEILKELEKNGEFGKMRKVIEAGALVNPNMGLKMSPFRETLGAFGSPIQSGANPIYWNQAEGIQGNYFAFPMAYLPEKHFSTYGSGFSTLPQELGGQISGKDSRFSGTPNA